MCYLEFAGVNHFSGLISQLENIHTAVEVVYIHDRFRTDVSHFMNFLAGEVKYLEI